MSQFSFVGHDALMLGFVMICDTLNRFYNFTYIILQLFCHFLHKKLRYYTQGQKHEIVDKYIQNLRSMRTMRNILSRRF